MKQPNGANERQAVIVLGILAVLVMFAAFIGFAIWDRPSEISPSPIPAQPSNPIPPSPPAPSAPENNVGKPAKPAGNPGTWVTTNDYPSSALQAEREGTSGFRLTISASGQPLFCSITSSSGHDDLDKATCEALMRRARFNPALDRSGNAVVSSYSSRVRWQIPQE